MWCDHIHMIVPLHTMNKIPFWFSLSANQRSSIRRVWYPSNRILGSRVCAQLSSSPIYPVFLWWLHHWIGRCSSPPHQGCPPCELLPSRKTASLCVCTPCMYSYMSMSCRADTRSSAGVGIVCTVTTFYSALSQQQLEVSPAAGIYTRNCSLEVIHPRPPPGTLFHSKLCNYCAQDAVIAELL